MVELTGNRCYVLWLKNNRDRISNEPTVFSSAAAAITEGERLKEKGIIKDYNFSIVSCPQIGGEMPQTNMLTGPTTEARVQL